MAIRDTKESWNTYCRGASFKYRYGITIEERNGMIAERDSCCDICGTRTGLHVDHDHETRTVRGMLCIYCNHGLGNFKDNTELLNRAVKYLQPEGRDNG